MVKGAIMDLPEDQRQQVLECKAKILALLKSYGEAGPLALVFIGAELAKDL